VIKTFNSDFGNFLTFHFRSGTPVGLEEKTVNHNNDVQVYPQPAQDIIHLTVDQLYLTKGSLLTMDGRLIKTFSEGEIAGNNLNVSEVTSGFYLLTLDGANGEHVVKKIVLNK
jgi:hypothetical protein